MSSSGSSSGSLQIEYSIEDQGQPLLTIVEAVSSVKDMNSQDLEPLERVIDVEALMELLSRESSEFYRNANPSSPSDVTVIFRYEGCIVEVDRKVTRVRPA